MKKQRNNSTRAWALHVALSIALLSISAVLVAASFKATPATRGLSATIKPAAASDNDLVTAVPPSIPSLPVIDAPFTFGNTGSLGTARAYHTATLPCTPDYTFTPGTGTIVPGTAEICNFHCDDCTTSILLPFTYQLYGQSFTGANLSSNGNLQFVSNSAFSTNSCMPTSFYNYPILPHWSDLRTDANPGCSTYPGGNCGIFTSVSGTAPNRIFNIEWRTVYYDAPTSRANFEVRLYEGQNRFDLVYGEVAAAGVNATVGVQKDSGSQFTQYECNAGGLTNGLQLVFTEPPCGTPTPTPTATATPTPSCTPDYTFTVGTGTIVPGTTEICNFHCDDCTTSILLPFTYQLYGQSFTGANLSSNGNLQFVSNSAFSTNSCMPTSFYNYPILPHWSDLRTDANPGCSTYPGGNCGIFTSVSGTAPNRIFNIEWRTVY